MVLWETILTIKYATHVITDILLHYPLVVREISYLCQQWPDKKQLKTLTHKPRFISTSLGNLDLIPYSNTWPSPPVRIACKPLRLRWDGERDFILNYREKTAALIGSKTFRRKKKHFVTITFRIFYIRCKNLSKQNHLEKLHNTEKWREATE